MNKKEFSILIKRYLAGDATEAEKRFVEAYYDEISPDLKIEDILTDQEITYLATDMSEDIRHRINIDPGKAIIRHINLKKYAAIAALLFATISVSLFFIIKQNRESANLTYNSYYTKRGKLSRVNLSDGTVVWLNSDSKFRCPQSFDGAATREVYLEGEAYFEVAKDKKHPFLVHSGNLTTRVLGTKFDVNAYHTNKAIEVTLLEGKVMLTTSAGPALHKKPDTLYLKPNEKAYFNQNNALSKSVVNTTIATIKPENKDTGKNIAVAIANETKQQSLSKIPVENAALSASWKDGRLTYAKESLENVIAALSRKYNVSISAKESLLNYPVTIDIGNEPIESVLFTVTKQLKHHDVNGNTEYNGDAQFKKVGSKYFIE